MSPDDEDEILDGVLSLVRAISSRPSGNIAAGTRIYIDLDFDSLQMLELVAAVEKNYSVQLLMKGSLLDDFATPSSIVAAIIRARRT